MDMSPREIMARTLYPMFFQNSWDRGNSNLRVLCLERVDALLGALRAQGHTFDTDDMEHARAMAEAFRKKLYCNGCPKNAVRS
jgi:hypothetical protein